MVEADGGQHADDASDTRRTAWLQSHGWRVIRFWNHDVLTNPEHVADTILTALTLTRRENAATSPASAREVK